MGRASELKLIIDLFAENENVNRLAFTKLYQRLSLGLSVKLTFDDNGVYAEWDGLDDNLLLYKGEFQLDLGGDDEDDKRS